MKVISLLTILTAVTIVAVLSINQFTNKSSGVKTQKTTLNQATSVAVQADLKAIATKLSLFYSENGTYPSNFDQVDSKGIDTNKYSLQTCGDQNSVLLKSNNSNETLLLINGDEKFGQDQTC